MKYDCFEIGSTCVAKSNFYEKIFENGKFKDGKDILLIKGKRYTIIRINKKTGGNFGGGIVVKDERNESSWTFDSNMIGYEFPFYTKEEYRNKIIEDLLK
jgi:hypothetical protein